MDKDRPELMDNCCAAATPQANPQKMAMTKMREISCVERLFGSFRGIQSSYLLNKLTACGAFQPRFSFLLCTKFFGENVRERMARNRNLHLIGAIFSHLRIWIADGLFGHLMRAFRSAASHHRASLQMGFAT